MTLEETIQKTRELSVIVAPQTTRFLQNRIAKDLVATVKQRWITQGVDSKGRSLMYSTKPCLLGYSDYPLNKKAYNRLKTQTKKYNKAAAKSGDKTLGGWVTVNGRALMVVDGGYKAIRNAAGYQITHVDFMIQGDMWRGVKVISVQNKGGIIEIAYGPTDIETNKKVEGHNKHFKTNILMPTTAEIQSIANSIGDYIAKEVKRKYEG